MTWNLEDLENGVLLYASRAAGFDTRGNIMAQAADGSNPPPDPERTTRGWRASDADRNDVAHVVQQALGAGMLTLAEAEERLTAVYAARFCDELVPLTADLPVTHAALNSRSPRASVPLSDALRDLVAASIPVGAAALAALSRHRVLAGVLLLLAGILFASLVVSTGAELFTPEHHTHGLDG